MILRPSEPVTELVARVALSGSTLSVALPAWNDQFVAAAKGLGVRQWDRDARAWTRSLSRFAGDRSHRAADVVRGLIAAGFPTEAPEDIARLALLGDYAPECRRWVHVGSGEYEGWFRIWWGREQEGAYQAARRIEGSRYDPETHCVMAPAEQVSAVEDFAALHTFQLSEEAQTLIAMARRAREAAVVADLQAPVREVPYWRRPTLAAPEVDVPAVDVPAEHLDFQDVGFAVTTALYPHQIPPVEKLRELKIGALFMEMGTGKTRCAIELVHLRRHRISAVVWFCPVSLKRTIAYEIEKHTDTPVDKILVFDEGTTLRSVPGAIWYVVGIESMSSSDRQVMATNGLIDDHTFVIVDESSYIKGHNAIRTERITALAERARYRLILTGTPISNGIEDLYAQMRFLSTDILGYGSFYSFAANHLEYSEKYPGMVVRAHNTEHIAAKIAPYVYQVTKHQAGLELPRKLLDARYFDMTREQAEWYQTAKVEILKDSPPEELDSVVIFRLFGALQQIASGFWQRSEDELIEMGHDRLRVLSDILANIPDGERVIIWCKFVYSVQAVSTHLIAEYGDGVVALLHGDLAEQERESEIARWRHGEARFLVATMATGGHGLTLIESAYAVFYENSFKYAERVQAEDRIHRIGQERRPTYIDVYMNCGIERRIERAIQRKESMVRAFRDDVEQAKDRTKMIEEL